MKRLTILLAVVLATSVGCGEKPQAPDPTLRIPYSDMIGGGKLDVQDVIQPTYDEINKKYGLNEKQD